MNKIIFGFTGLLASGKGTATKHLEQKYGAISFHFSSILRDITNRLYLAESRDHLIRLSEALRATFGEDILAKTIAGDAAKSDQSIIVVEGIRRMSDITHLSQLPNFVLVEIFAEPVIRYERLIKRRENVDDANKTYEQFLADHQRTTELSILDVIPHATERLDNNGNLPSLYQQLDVLVAKYA